MSDVTKKTAKKNVAKKTTKKKATKKKAKRKAKKIPECWNLNGEAKDSKVPLVQSSSGWTEELSDKDVKPSYRKMASALISRACRGMSSMRKSKIGVSFGQIDVKTARYLHCYRAPNRKMSTSMVKQYIEAMYSGIGWRFTGQPIILDETYRVVDGQHRLAAVVESGKGIEVLVVSGVPRSAFKDIDTGRNRSAKHMLQTFRDSKGRPLAYSLEISQGIGLAMMYSKLVQSKSGRMSRAKIHPNRAYGVFEKFREFDKITHWFKEIQSQLDLAGVTSSVAVCSMFFTFQTNASMADDFWDKLASGADLSKTSPILHVRDFLKRTQIMLDKTKQRPKGVSGLILDVIIQGWNLFVAGKHCRKSLEITESGKPYPFFKDSEPLMRKILKAVEV